MSRPNIGVTAATEEVSYGVWEGVPAFMSPARYVAAVQRAGGRALLLPPAPEDPEDPGGVLELLDALIVTGGVGGGHTGPLGLGELVSGVEWERGRLTGCRVQYKQT